MFLVDFVLIRWGLGRWVRLTVRPTGQWQPPPNDNINPLGLCLLEFYSFPG